MNEQEMLQKLESLQQEVDSLKKDVKKKTIRKRIVVPFAVLAAMLISILAFAATIPHSFTTGGVISATNFNNNFSYIAARLWELTGSDLYYTAGNVGIGTTGPNTLLEVGQNYDYGSTDHRTYSPFRVSGLDGLGRVNIGYDTADEYGFLQSADNTVAQPLLLNPDGGSVGIGTTSPGAKLEVSNGNILVSGTGKVDFGLERIQSAAGNGDAWVYANCTGTKKIMGGGCYCSSSPSNPVITHSYPTSQTQYACIITQCNSSSVYAYAICANIQ